MGSITQTNDFRKNAEFILRINDCSIYKKESWAEMDAGYYVTVDCKGKQVYRDDDLSAAIKTAMQTPNSKRKYLYELTKAQREKIAPILRKHGESIKDLD